MELGAIFPGQSMSLSDIGLIKNCKAAAKGDS